MMNIKGEIHGLPIIITVIAELRASSKVTTLLRVLKIHTRVIKLLPWVQVSTLSLQNFTSLCIASWTFKTYFMPAYML